MAQYQDIRKNRIQENAAANARPANSAAPAAANSAEDADSGEKLIPIDGFSQVVALLRAADPKFRESLLNRLSRKDPALGRQLREKVSD